MGLTGLGQEKSMYKITETATGREFVFSGSIKIEPDNNTDAPALIINKLYNVDAEITNSKVLCYSTHYLIQQS